MISIYLITIIIIILLAILYYFYKSKQTDQSENQPKPIIAIAHLNQNDGIKGNVYFYQDASNQNVMIDINIAGLPTNARLGFHIHEAGDLTDGMHFCMCSF